MKKPDDQKPAGLSQINQERRFFRTHKVQFNKFYVKGRNETNIEEKRYYEALRKQRMEKSTENKEKLSSSRETEIRMSFSINRG